MKKNTLNMSQINGKESGKLIVKPFMQDEIELHDHDFLELAYVTCGSAMQNLDGVTEAVSEGDYFLIDYGEAHGYQECKNFMLLNCLFLPEVIDESLEGCRSLEELLRVSMVRYYRRMPGVLRAKKRIFHDESGRVRRILEGLQEEYEKRELGWLEIARGRLKEILLLMTRDVLANTETGSAMSTQSDSLTADILTYLEKNFSERNALAGFCEKNHYNLSYISRHFHSEAGVTATQYLQRLRVDYGCAMLLGGATCAETARAVGYDDIKFFERVFKRMMGVSPSVYKRDKKDLLSSTTS